MLSSGYREEVFNVLLALLLHKRGVVTAPEQSLRQAIEQRRHVSDVLVVYRGLRTVIEGKVADKTDTDEKALEQVRDRVNSGIAHIGIALLCRSLGLPDLSVLRNLLAQEPVVCLKALL